MSPILAARQTEKLAILGGPKCVPLEEPDLFAWPIVISEDEQAVLEVLRAGKMSGWDITMQFEAEFAKWQGTKFALGHCNGTSALLAAMFGVGVGRGDEIICPSLTYWASALPAFSLGASVVFADIDPDSLCIDPADIEHRISPRTRAIVVVHYCGHPCDMDPIMAIAARHGLKIIEDVSHAHGALYKGRKCGSLGHVGAMSMMAGKSFPIGEGGMLCTDDRTIYERAVAFGHYERTGGAITLPELKPFVGLPMGGYKFRMNQTCAAMGRVQLKHYDARVAEIQRAMNRFWDLLEGVPGLRPHRPAAGTGSTMGGWYNPLGHYVPEELAGLPVEKFLDAVTAEGGRCGRGCNFPLHLHPVLNTADAFRDGTPTRIAFAGRDLRQPAGSLPVSEALAGRAFGIPWFKHDRPASIERYAAAFAKVATQAGKLAV
ncbi:MAG: DegT/DnrJ/EryC1/StrS family aminotransferase [Phycisphaerae bacterium]|nr:DegT/DnrJ/EryC1/StrS family aminotransferase [Phycisphaerae bacterium]